MNRSYFASILVYASMCVVFIMKWNGHKRMIIVKSQILALTNDSYVSLSIQASQPTYSHLVDHLTYSTSTRTRTLIITKRQKLYCNVKKIIYQCQNNSWTVNNYLRTQMQLRKFELAYEFIYFRNHLNFLNKFTTNLVFVN